MVVECKRWHSNETSGTRSSTHLPLTSNVLLLNDALHRCAFPGPDHSCKSIAPVSSNMVSIPRSQAHVNTDSGYDFKVIAAISRCLGPFSARTMLLPCAKVTTRTIDSMPACDQKQSPAAVLLRARMSHVACGRSSSPILFVEQSSPMICRLLFFAQLLTLTRQHRGSCEIHASLTGTVHV